MPTLELVCKRLFSDPSWFIKCVIGALLILVPVVNFFALGYLFSLIERGRRSEVVLLPDWEDWRSLFINGASFFVILLVLCLLPIGVGWLLSLPLPASLGHFGRLAMVPGLMLGAPLTAAGVYRFQRRESFRDAFRMPVLWTMLGASKFRFFVPTLSFLGLVWVASPLLPFALFTGGAAVFTFYACFFRHLEDSRTGGGRTASA